MLKEINCDKFIISPITFHSGLNTILGDNYSTNSIGKSTFLMIVDFIFGGSSFIENNSGAIDQLGQLTFKFKFEFDSKYHYFIRSTEERESVGICDNSYNIINHITLDNYTTNLKSLYNASFEASFRGTVNPYSRIWKKDNYNVDKPILNYIKEAESVSIENLIKLFSLYKEISKTSLQIKDQEESKKILTGMFKKNFIPKVTKTEFQKNISEIDQINNEVTDIQNNLLKFTLNIEELSSKEIIDLKTQKQKLLESQSTILNKIRRLELNLDNTNIKSKYFNRLSEFFENPNEEKIKEIEAFHSNIAKILRRELEATKEVLVKENDVYKTELDEIDAKIEMLLANVESPKFIVEKIFDLTIKVNKLKEVNKFYSKREEVIEDVKTLNLTLDETIDNILSSIETQINTELVRINKEIHSESKKTPRISLNKKNYKYDHSDNTGTGKSYSDLIEFDLTILKLTELPFIIHDSILFKNIEDKAIDKIIEQYSLFRKQIFIALDGINRYSAESQKILNDSCVLQINETRKLFNRDWR